MSRHHTPTSSPSASPVAGRSRSGSIAAAAETRADALAGLAAPGMSRSKGASDLSAMLGRISLQAHTTSISNPGSPHLGHGATNDWIRASAPPSALDPTAPDWYQQAPPSAFSNHSFSGSPFSERPATSGSGRSVTSLPLQNPQNPSSKRRFWAAPGNSNSSAPSVVHPNESSSWHPPMSLSSTNDYPEARTTSQLHKQKDELGRRMVNQYARLEVIGKGCHGTVWLCEDTTWTPYVEEGETSRWCALKCVDRQDRRNRNLHRSRLPTSRPLGRERPVRDSDWGHGEPSGGGGGLTTPRDEKSDVFSDEKLFGRFRGQAAAAETGEVSGGSRGSSIRQDESVRREIAIMKRCRHPHVVRLIEVIDDVNSKKIFMALEYMAGGQIEWQNEDTQRPTLTVEQARRTFRDVVLGLEYLHYHGIIHRDIKPANLLWSGDHQTVKISDFGVSHLSEALEQGSKTNDEKALRKTAGSPAFFAPELCYPTETTPVSTPQREHPEGAASFLDLFSPNRQNLDEVISQAARPELVISRPMKEGWSIHKRPPLNEGIDIWALGVTLYCILFGKTPFAAKTEYELYNIIPHHALTLPLTMGADDKPVISNDLELEAEGSEVRDLLGRLLEKDPTKRITLGEVKRHPWVLRNLGCDPEAWLIETSPDKSSRLTVTKEDVDQAIPERGNDAERLPSGGFREAIKRAAQHFGPLLSLGSKRATVRKTRTKSNSSLSGSAATHSEPNSSRAASRQPSAIGIGSGPPLASLIGRPRATSNCPSRPDSPSNSTQSLQAHSHTTRSKVFRSPFGSKKRPPPQHASTIGPVQTVSTAPSSPSLDLHRSVSGSSSTSIHAQCPTPGTHGLHLQLPQTQQPPHCRRYSGTKSAAGTELSPNEAFAEQSPETAVRRSLSLRPSSPLASPIPDIAEKELHGLKWSWASVKARVRSGSRTPGTSTPGRRSKSDDTKSVEDDFDEAVSESFGDYHHSSMSQGTRRSSPDRAFSQDDLTSEVGGPLSSSIGDLESDDHSLVDANSDSFSESSLEEVPEAVNDGSGWVGGGFVKNHAMDGAVEFDLRPHSRAREIDNTPRPNPAVVPDDISLNPHRHASPISIRRPSMIHRMSDTPSRWSHSTARSGGNPRDGSIRKESPAIPPGSEDDLVEDLGEADVEDELEEEMRRSQIAEELAVGDIAEECDDDDDDDDDLPDDSVELEVKPRWKSRAGSQAMSDLMDAMSATSG